jgi:DNA mismatch repair ATPase MutL
MVDGEPSSRSFGLNGEALASLSDISVVEVRTKARGRPNSYCKIIKVVYTLNLLKAQHNLDTYIHSVSEFFWQIYRDPNAHTWE